MVGFSDEIFDVVLMGEKQTHLAVATNSSVIKLYTVANMACHLLKGHSDLVISLASTPANPNLLVSGAKDNSIRLWLMNSEGSVNCIATGTRHTSSVTAIALGRNNSNLLVSAGEDTTLKIWSLPKKFNQNSIESLSVKCTEVAHEKDINGLCIAPNDKIMATASLDKTAKLWSASDLSLMGVLKGHKRGVWSVKFSPVDQVLATTSADSTLRLWSLADLSCLKTFEGHGSSVLRVEFLSRGLQLVSVGSDGLLKLWCIKSSECMATFDEHDGKVWALAVTSDEKSLVTGGDDSKLLFWTDETEAARVEAANAKQARIENEQRLDNLIHNKMLLPALDLALRLERPATVLKIITKLQQESAESLEDVIRKLDVDKKGSLLKCLISWNSNSKQAYSAQVVLSVLLDDIIKGDLRLPSSDMESLIVFSDRHFKRLTQLQQDLQILKYTANIMLPHAK
ncbi:hypothetical protein LSTR_LSTR005387 [Laodelphax striatellus]|uniref:U3 small nucleolar RNA-associated protein 13 C-terminal domain-containing protein n=1 Tax=Laodelphax striatellus TaxID=195883 RepID=A0A482WR15_LAOST|nr:hypothetical protein LSTR_LSTR005387 [Laodelphax striatellus]